MNTGSLIPQAYNCNVLEGNWYEDRCVSDFDNNKKKNYLLPNPNDWQYSSTYSTLGVDNENKLPNLKAKFGISNDNYINFQGKKNDMFVSTYKYNLLLLKNLETLLMKSTEILSDLQPKTLITLKIKKMS